MRLADLSLEAFNRLCTFEDRLDAAKLRRDLLLTPLEARMIVVATRMGVDEIEPPPAANFQDFHG